MIWTYLFSNLFNPNKLLLMLSVRRSLSTYTHNRVVQEKEAVLSCPGMADSEAAFEWNNNKSQP